MENNSKENKLMEIIDNIPITEENKQTIKDIKKSIEENQLEVALEKLNELSSINKNKEKKIGNKSKKSERKNISYVYPKELIHIWDY